MSGSDASEEVRSATGRLLRRGSIYVFANSLKIGAIALAIPIATRILDPADYGTVTLATTLQLLLAILAAMGLQEATLRFFYDKEHGAPTARALIASTTLVAVGVTAAVAAVVLMARAFGSDFTLPLLFGAALGLPTAVTGSCLSLLRAQERTGPFVAVALTSTVGAQALAIVGIVIKPEPATYLAGVLVAVTSAALVGLLLTHSIPFRLAGRSTLRSALAYGLPTVPYTASVFALAFADRFVIAAIEGSSAVGKYQVAFAFGFLGVMLVQSLQLAWAPMTFGGSEANRWETLGEISGSVIRLAALASGFLALAARPALSVLVPGDYDTDLLAEVAAVASLATVGWAIFLARTQVLLWKKQTRPLGWITPVSAALNLGLVAVLLPPFGLEGAAAATVIAVVVQAALISGAARRIVDVSWRTGSELLAWGVAAGCVGLALLLPETAAGTSIRIAAMALTGLGLMAALAAELKLTRSAAPADAGPQAPDATFRDRSSVDLG